MSAVALLKLQRSGFTEPQVEALAEYLDSQAATRADLLEMKGELRAEIAEVRAEIADVRAELKADIAEVRAELAGVRAGLKADIAELRVEIADVRADIRQLERRMTIRLGGMMVAAVAAVSVLVKLL